jgi:hypothetical protein
MARLSAFNVKIGVDEVDALAQRLSELSPDAIGALLVDAINETTDSAYELARKAILGGINLTDSYVQSHMAVEHATANKPEASIVAYGGKGHTTSLSHYGAMQLTKSITWSNARIEDEGHKLTDKWPGWVRRTGDEARGIAYGAKTAGVSVQVTRGTQKTLKTSKAILMPGIRDSEGNAMVFKRVAGSGREKSKLQALQGPSVYQLFRVAGAAIEQQVYGDLERSVMDAAERHISKELT